MGVILNPSRWKYPNQHGLLVEEAARVEEGKDDDLLLVGWIAQNKKGKATADLIALLLNLYNFDIVYKFCTLSLI